jgi:hypothetical protein
MIRLLRREFDVPVSLTNAWHFLARVQEWPRWAAHIRHLDVVPAGELGPASSGRIYLANGIRSAFRMREFQPGKNWEWVGPFLWLTVHYDHQFEAVSQNRTRLTWLVDAEGLGASIFGRVFAKVYSRNLDKAIPVLVSCIGQVKNVGEET